ncbi:hypothetical protein N9W17_01270 [Jannaschia sp.]|nr:hypothetical protein [Jannaschia sp.]
MSHEVRIGSKGRAAGLRVPSHSVCRGIGTIVAVCLSTSAANAGPCEAPSFDTTLAALQSDGWAETQTLTPAQTEALAWTRAITYITGDDGGLSPAQVLDLQRAAAPGLLKRVDTDTTRSAVLTRDTDAMTITETQTAPGLRERRCRFATATPIDAPAIDTTGWPGAPALADLILTFEETDE